MSFEAYLGAVKAKTGKSAADLARLAEKQDYAMAIVAWLKGKRD